MIKHIKPGPRLSGAVVHNGIVYVSGQVPNTPYASVRVSRLSIAAAGCTLRSSGTEQR
jgi:enamine deaminase RidA (YjgF/YER057c/UK114 family)